MSLRQTLGVLWDRINGLSSGPCYATVWVHSLKVYAFPRFDHRNHRLVPAEFDTEEEALNKAASMGPLWYVKQHGQKFYICEHCRGIQ
jgi:hypothetical protein